MAKEFSKAFYNSRAWQSCRASYIAMRMNVDGGMCEKCHELPGAHLHHKIILTPANINDTNITLNFDNLCWECKLCHDEEENHFKDSKGNGGKHKQAAAVFDENGCPIDARKL